VHPIAIAIEHLQLLGVEPSLFDELRCAEAMLEGGSAIQVTHPGLNERTEVAGSPMGEFHHPAGLAFEVDHVPTANICGLHRVSSK
jgi:hypothetical protein